MDNSVIIKGNKNGIVVVLDEKMDFGELKNHAVDKFRASSKFLGDAKTAIAFEGRQLTEQQQFEMLDIIDCNTDLEIVCILEHNEQMEARFERALNDKLMELSSATGQFYKGTLRSGQCLEMETSVIIIGDVNAGASIVSKGNIIVLGSLKGTAFAGAAGNENAFVMASDMNPVQVRIADTIARSPDNRERESAREAKIAFLENGNIYIEPVNKKVLNDIKL